MKKALASLILFSLILVLYFNNYSRDEKLSAKSTNEVLENAWVKFDLLGYGVVETDQIISIDISVTESESEVREYLNKNLPEEALRKYNIKTFELNEESLERKEISNS